MPLGVALRLWLLLLLLLGAGAMASGAPPPPPPPPGIAARARPPARPTTTTTTTTTMPMVVATAVAVPVVVGVGVAPTAATRVQPPPLPSKRPVVRTQTQAVAVPVPVPVPVSTNPFDALDDSLGFGVEGQTTQGLPPALPPRTPVVVNASPPPPARTPMQTQAPPPLPPKHPVKPQPPPPPPPRDDRYTHVVTHDYDPSPQRTRTATTTTTTTTTTTDQLPLRAGEYVRVVSAPNASAGGWCTVATSHKKGLAPASYLAPIPPERARPPPTPRGFDYGTLSGNCRDVIAVLTQDASEAFMTPIRARFWGASANAGHVGDAVQVWVDGRPAARLRMGVGGWVEGGDGRLSSLVHHPLPQPGPYHLRLEHTCAENPDSPIRFAHAVLWVWRVDDVVAVSDVDGTITRSDVKGHLNTTVMQKMGFEHAGYAHAGVCALFSHLAERTRCRFVFLTSRPLDLVQETRNYVLTLSQATMRGPMMLPAGPVVTDTTTYYGSMRRELVDKTSHLFKREFLLELRGCFEAAGRDIWRSPVFMVGFGNKDTDAAAYEAAGVPRVLTFIINSRSVISGTAMGFAADLDSYEDPSLLSFLDEKCALFVGGRMPLPP